MSNQSDELSPIARCLQIAAARGRAIRLTREKYGLTTAEAVKKLDELSGRNTNAMSTIYALRDPATLEIRYVGQIKGSLNESLRRHISDKAINAKTEWIRGLKERKSIPLIEEIEKVDPSVANERKQYWIDLYRSQG
jgi:hypothetical protein